jgi:nitrite reductase/ring-hydroxylating ferredoxin subunit
MRRNDQLVVITRRSFCALAGGIGLAVLGCTDGDTGVVETGPLGDHPDAPDAIDDPDARPGSPDARPGTPDAMTGPACTGTATDVGVGSAFTSGAPKLFTSGAFFVVRDAGGLYAVSSRCTHEGATNGVSGTRFRCPRHGALFNFDGSIISGPVSRVLVHYAMCVMPGGHVGVMTGQTVDAGARLVV